MPTIESPAKVCLPSSTQAHKQPAAQQSAGKLKAASPSKISGAR